MSKIGKNEPCPCGSGKKFKQCCQDRIKAEQRCNHAQADFPQRVTPEKIQKLKEDRQRHVQGNTPKRILQNEKKLPGSMDGEMDEMIWKWETAEQFMEKKSAIMAIIEKLDDYRKDYEAWNRDDSKDVFLACMRLFAEAPFEKVRFKKEDITRIVKAQGTPPSIDDYRRFVDYVSRAVKTLLDDKELTVITQLLFLQIPVYYSQKRYMDAYLILNSAHLLIPFNEEKNSFLPAFLLCKFMQALRTWTEDRAQESIGFLQKIGIGIESLRKKIQARRRVKDMDIISEDQEVKFEDYLDEHPLQKDELHAQIVEYEETMKKLLDSKEGSCLVLIGKEMEPWILRLAKGMKANQRLQDNANQRKILKDQECITIFSEIMEKVSGEMAVEIFTGKRMTQLNKDIQAVRKKLEKQGRKEYNVFLDSWLGINKTFSPKFSIFNVMLCKFSLIKTLRWLQEYAEGIVEK